MVDINLLDDTTGEGDENKNKKAKKPPERIEYTKPSIEPKENEQEAKVKSGLLGGIFKKKTVSTAGAELPPPPPLSRPSARPIETRSIPKETPAAYDAGQPPAKPKTGIFGNWFGRRPQPANPPGPASTPNPPGGSAEARFRASYAQKEKVKKTDSQVLEEKVISSKQPRALPVEEPPTEEKPSFLDVNLMPADLMVELEPRKKLILYAIVTGISMAFVAAIYFGLQFYESRIQKDVEETSGQIAEVEKSIAALRKEQSAAILFKSRTDQVKDALDKHIHWTNFFSKLEANTISDVQYDSFAGSFSSGSNPTFSLNAVGRDFSSVARQIKAFEGPKAADFITSVRVDRGERTLPETADEKEFVRFGIQFTVLESLFYDTASSVSSTGVEGEE
ncbi:MAG: hypothetical protein WC497_00420 [Patescibacteria group bacterium]